jgi:2-oxo-3-hexenedioate decarboxylase
MTAAASDALATELIGLDEAPREVPPFGARYPGLTPESGYRAAAQVHAHRVASGWKPLGRKIGFTNRTLWQRYGVHEPMWGMVYDRTMLVAAGDRIRYRLPASYNPVSSRRSASS